MILKLYYLYTWKPLAGQEPTFSRDFHKGSSLRDRQGIKMKHWTPGSRCAGLQRAGVTQEQ